MLRSLTWDFPFIFGELNYYLFLKTDFTRTVALYQPTVAPDSLSQMLVLQVVSVLELCQGALLHPSYLLPGKFFSPSVI